MNELISSVNRIEVNFGLGFYLRLQQLFEDINISRTSSLMERITSSYNLEHWLISLLLCSVRIYPSAEDNFKKLLKSFNFCTVFYVKP